MKKTSFGRMKKHKLRMEMLDRAEVMHFDGPGKFHKHDDYELAFLVKGKGSVEICFSDDGLDEIAVPYRMEEGDVLEIPFGRKHRMIPDEGESMYMLIAYGKLK